MAGQKLKVLVAYKATEDEVTALDAKLEELRSLPLFTHLKNRSDLLRHIVREFLSGTASLIVLEKKQPEEAGSQSLELFASEANTTVGIASSESKVEDSLPQPLDADEIPLHLRLDLLAAGWTDEQIEARWLELNELVNTSSQGEANS